jgi:hypothetical protein
VKAYKHVRDTIIANKKIDETIANLVNVIPHREYREGFLFNKLADFPETETNPPSPSFIKEGTSLP